MTPDQVSLVRATWQAAVLNADALTVAFYARLFAIDVGAAALFAGVDMAAQRTKLAQSLGVVVHALDDLDRLMPAIAALGKRHSRYGVADQHFDSVGSALLGALGDTLGPEFSDEAHHAWGTAYALVAAVMRRALVRSEHPGAPLEQ